MNTAVPQTLTRLLACAAPPLWFSGLFVMLTAQRLPLGLFLLPCVVLFLFSAAAAWHATRIGVDANAIGMPTRIGLHVGGVWVLPYAMIALLTLISYPRLLPTYLAMLLPAMAYTIWPGNMRRFGQLLGIGVALAAIATWMTVVQHLPIETRLAISIETVAACTMAAMPVWTLVAYTRLVRRHHAGSPQLIAVVVIAPIVLMAAVYGQLVIGMSGMAD